MQHISVSELGQRWASVGSGNGLSPIWRQAITWTNAGLLSNGLLWTNFSETQIKTPSCSFKKMHLKLLSAKMAATLSMGRWVNPLRAKFFRGNIKHIFTFYVIPPHWYDTSGIDISCKKKHVTHDVQSSGNFHVSMYSHHGTVEKNEAHCI